MVAGGGPLARRSQPSLGEGRGAGRRVPGAGCRVPGAGRRVPGAGCPNKGGGSLARRQIRRFNQGKWKNVKNNIARHLRTYNYIYNLRLKAFGLFQLE